MVLHAWFAYNDDDHTSHVSSDLHSGAMLIIHLPYVMLGSSLMS